jgi:hypothetical protein
MGLWKIVLGVKDKNLRMGLWKIVLGVKDNCAGVAMSLFV